MTSDLASWSRIILGTEPDGSNGPGIEPKGPPGAFGPPIEAASAPALHGPRARTRSQIAKGSASKGASGEREVLAAFRDIMRNVEEGLKVDGLEIVGRSDFAARKRIEKGVSNRDLGNIPLISIEIKRQENLQLSKAWDQAVRQADQGELPVLIYRYNREAWRVRTWVALTTPAAAIDSYVIGELSLPDFLAYYSRIYKAFLKEGLS